MKIVIISDTHLMLNKVTIPKGDLLLHAGDLTFRGSIEECVRANEQFTLLRPNFPLGIIGIPGNHDFLAEKHPSLFRSIMSNVTILIDEEIVVDGIKFYGSPITPFFKNWAFNRHKYQIRPYWDAIPDNTDILITHGPPHGILDTTKSGQSVGCPNLENRVKQLSKGSNLKYHIFGHIHECYGTYQKHGIQFINASTCTENYDPINKPIIINT